MKKTFCLLVILGITGLHAGEGADKETIALQTRIDELRTEIGAGPFLSDVEAKLSNSPTQKINHLIRLYGECMEYNITSPTYQHSLARLGMLINRAIKLQKLKIEINRHCRSNE